jgi:vacuolar-type H+-ATPase subunit E/Vma4
MALDALLAALARDAEAEAAALIEGARTRAAAQVAAAEAGAARRRDAAHGAVERERRAVLARELAVAEREAAARLLEARAATLAELLGEARAALAVLAPARWTDRLPPLVEAALGCLPPDSLLEVPAAAVAPARRAAGARARVESRPDAPAGLFGRDAGGRVEVDLTLPGLLDQRREELAARLAARIEAEA